MELKLSSSASTWLRKYDTRKRTLSMHEYALIKRALDLALTILSMPIWLPLVGLIALAIKVSSPGAPVFFMQQRTGMAGRRFAMYKFRTMVPNAEALKEKYAHLNELKWPDFKIKNDPRMTRLGRVLRRSSLDELPQLFNILRGEMSLVGPRPTFFSPESYRLWHTARLDVVPGLTGLWQITVRSTVDWDNRTRLDIAYVERRCLMLDIEILFRTIPMVFAAHGAA
jgi:lipopolysaccharide/colanic/teichoic acid biosynthesis glycosyltransferase